ncbi:MAG: 50S ribosomal protein L19e [Candidatus Marsarchaeota archaeon]|jgi:large subunit ribosomal protein L19e|nr:50S ribosomal protein L19e [Candidatus Marsarchaeota archaeon]
MSIRLTKRVAASIMGRGESAVRISAASIADAKKAITREDVRELIKKGAIYAIKEKHNISAHGKELSKKRAAGRKRGPGRKHGTYKARAGITYMKKVRAQRRVLLQLKSAGTINNEMFKGFYALVKGGTFASKATLLNHIRSRGVAIDEESFNKLKHA